MRIDQVMLGQMMGDKAVGFYSVTTRILEMDCFIPMAVMSSLALALIEIRKADRARYDVQIQRVFNLMVLLALAITIDPCPVCAPFLEALCCSDAPQARHRCDHKSPTYLGIVSL